MESDYLAVQIHLCYRLRSLVAAGNREVLKNILTLLGYKVPDPLPVEGLSSTNPNEPNPLISEEISREPR